MDSRAALGSPVHIHSHLRQLLRRSSGNPANARGNGEENTRRLHVQYMNFMPERSSIYTVLPRAHLQTSCDSLWPFTCHSWRHVSRAVQTQEYTTHSKDLREEGITKSRHHLVQHPVMSESSAPSTEYRCVAKGQGCFSICSLVPGR